MYILHPPLRACTDICPTLKRCKRTYYIGVRGPPERDISSLRALDPGGRQVLRVVRAACALSGRVGKVAISCIENIGFV